MPSTCSSSVAFVQHRGLEVSRQSMKKKAKTGLCVRKRQEARENKALRREKNVKKVMSHL